MADKINEPKYEAMISALSTFASSVYAASSELQSLASVCVQAIGDDDKAAPEIYKRIKDSQLKYADATDQAKDIAAKMQEELDDARKEDNVWNGSD